MVSVRHTLVCFGPGFMREVLPNVTSWETVPDPDGPTMTVYFRCSGCTLPHPDEEPWPHVVRHVRRVLVSRTGLLVRYPNEPGRPATELGLEGTTLALIDDPRR